MTLQTKKKEKERRKKRSLKEPVFLFFSVWDYQHHLYQIAARRYFSPKKAVTSFFHKESFCLLYNSVSANFSFSRRGEKVK